ncbi:MAG TPA: maleylpyruvate isomerase family mycothiol-dependent enzyme [Candidatus Dormibacteraeota bacterium]|nr:maleylpyruvate isomerase family mycothiol-dependent enzyme [Candidatus Dormibacteraeota bacterium]
MSVALAELVPALRASHQRLLAALTPLTAADVTGPSYCTDWTIAQAASHLGSGSEIFAAYVDAGLAQSEAPGGELQHPIWDRWNAKAPMDQVRDAVVADAAFVDKVAALTGAEPWHLELFGGERGLADIVRMRLSEHTAHTWDIAVAQRPDATLDEQAVALLLDTLPGLSQHAGKPSPPPLRVRVTTSGPAHEFVLDLSETGSRVVEPADAGPDGTATASLRLPAEAFLRLVFGRLDAAHTPAGVVAEGVDLDRLRAAFPGF